MAAHLEIAKTAFGEAEKGFELISEVTTRIDDDTIATTRIYEKEEPTSYYSTWTNKTYEGRVLYTHNNFDWAIVTAQGNFSWDGDTAKVSSAAGNATRAFSGSSIDVKKGTTRGYSDCGSNALLGNKYAYVEQKATATNGTTTHNYTFELVVNRNGKTHTNPSYGEYWEVN